MAGSAFAETLRPPEIEPVDLRTDKLLFNVWHLHKHYDKATDTIDPIAIADVDEQNITGVSESDIHEYAPVVYQDLDESIGQYRSLDEGTIDISIKGWRASIGVAEIDSRTEFDVWRRLEDVAVEDSVLWPEVNKGMREGGIKVNIMPRPTHHEADPDIATKLNYDDRDMLILQSLSPDGKRKKMISFSIFDIPINAWVSLFSDRYGKQVEPTALAVMQACHEIPLESGSTNEVLQTLIGGVIDYVPETDKPKVQAQLDAFVNKQDELAAHAAYYGKEKTAIQMEVARCLNDWATPKILNMVNAVREELHPKQKMELSKRYTNGKLHVDDFVAELIVKIKTVTTNNRAGLATLNHRTVQRAAYKLGMEKTILMAEREQAIQQAQAQQQGMEELMVRQNEQQIARAGLECQGGCEVIIIDLFSADGKDAREAGLKGTLYESEELNKNSQCSCEDKSKAKVISDGKNVICTTCKDYMVGGKKGSLKKSTAKAA